MFKNCVFKNSVDTRKWMVNAGIRAVKTMAQTADGFIFGGCGGDCQFTHFGGRAAGSTVRRNIVGRGKKIVSYKGI